MNVAAEVWLAGAASGGEMWVCWKCGELAEGCLGVALVRKMLAAALRCCTVGEGPVFEGAGSALELGAKVVEVPDAELTVGEMVFGELVVVEVPVGEVVVGELDAGELGFDELAGGVERDVKTVDCGVKTPTRPP